MADLRKAVPQTAKSVPNTRNKNNGNIQEKTTTKTQIPNWRKNAAPNAENLVQPPIVKTTWLLLLPSE
jgi:hypothetical protein